MSAVILRPYQISALESIEAALSRGASPIVMMATGLGKGEVLAEHVARFVNRGQGRVVVMSHRREILDQLERSICVRMEPRRVHRLLSIPGGRSRTLSAADVVIGSVQSLVSRSKHWSRSEFALAVIDEAHHVAARSYRRVLKRLPQCQAVGYTATPQRLDGRTLGHAFDEFACWYDLRDGIRDGWLVPIERHLVDVEAIDLSSLRTVRGDFSVAEMEAMLCAEVHLHRIASPLPELSEGRQTLIFTASRRHARMLADVLGRYARGRVGVVDSLTPALERELIIQRFRDGDIQFLINCELFVEGIDLPSTSCVVMARATQSRALFRQAVGRGTRLCPTCMRPCEHKPNLRLLEFEFSSRMHRICDSADLLLDRDDAALAHGHVTRGACVELDADLASALAKASAYRLRVDVTASSRRESYECDTSAPPAASAADEDMEGKHCEAEIFSYGRRQGRRRCSRAATTIGADGELHCHQHRDDGDLCFMSARDLPRSLAATMKAWRDGLLRAYSLEAIKAAFIARQQRLASGATVRREDPSITGGACL